MRDSATPYLQPGEQIQAVIGAQTASGFVAGLGGILIFLGLNRYRILVATPQRILSASDDVSVAVYQSDPSSADDSGYEPGSLAHLVVSNPARLLDPRRTPLQVVAVTVETGLMRLRVLAFEDVGALWECRSSRSTICSFRCTRRGCPTARRLRSVPRGRSVRSHRAVAARSGSTASHARGDRAAHRSGAVAGDRGGPAAATCRFGHVR
ncbi:MAG: hypothetical protein DLM58_00495 [Pseudonocardiales bacterium]|nr:MAG: hypothetical protein DLM58_00495 [Pseudonocardiales bacterium]